MAPRATRSTSRRTRWATATGARLERPPLGRLHGRERLDAARRRLEPRPALSRCHGRRKRERGARPRDVLRPRPRAHRPRHGQPRRLRRLDVPRRRHRPRDRLRVHGLPAGAVRRLPGLPVHRRLRLSRPRDEHDPHAVLHLECDRRHAELLRDRLEGRELHLDRGLRLHARARLRVAHGVRRRARTRDESTSYYWAVLPSPNYERQQRRR